MSNKLKSKVDGLSGMRTLGIATALFIAVVGFVPSIAQTAAGQSSILVDDFESYEVGGLPVKWKYSRAMVPIDPSFMRPDEEFFVVDDDGNKALRVHTAGEAVHMIMANEEDGFEWDIRNHPRVAWDWRALRLPEGAREDKEKLNDSGAGLYILFKVEGLIIKRPKAIKYVYSSTLPVGTVVTYGKLKVVVASSALDGIGEWVEVVRDVASDYRRLFKEDPPKRPLALRLWSDSDNTNKVADADFDNIRFLSSEDQ